VFGPRQSPHGEGGVVSIIGSRLLSGEPVTVYGDGRQTRDFVFVADIASAALAAASHPPVGRVNIGTGTETTVNELYRQLAALAGRGDAPVSYAPARPGEVLRSCLDATRAARVLGWQPRVTLGDGLTATMQWLRTGRDRRSREQSPGTRPPSAHGRADAPASIRTSGSVDPADLPA
jgi:UDP-glucose 4-epimerase